MTDREPTLQDAPDSGDAPLDLEAAGQLFGAYLHQDWTDEFESDAAAVEAMIADEPPATVAAAAAEIRRLLASGLDEAEIARVMTIDAGCYYDPASGGESYRAWLDRVAARLEKGAD